MTDGRGRQVAVRRVPILDLELSPRASRVAQWVLATLLAVIVVAALSLSPDWVLAGRPSPVVLVLALSIGILAFTRLERRSIERDLHAARVRSLDARDLERQRIQRDLHDSAQQRLVSVRVHLGLLAEATNLEAERAAIGDLSDDLDAALKEISAVTSEGYPEVLLAAGVPSSVRVAISNAPIPISIETVDFRRYPEAIERNVYFCCMEAVQNVVKHAGRSAAAKVRFIGGRNRIIFEVEDTGVGFDPARVKPGDGLANIADRLASLNGRLVVDTRPGMGTRIRGEVPIG